MLYGKSLLKLSREASSKVSLFLGRQWRFTQITGRPATDLVQLAVTYRQSGKVAAAERCCRSVVQMKRASLHERNAAIRELAAALEAQGRYHEAETILAQMLN